MPSVEVNSSNVPRSSNTGLLFGIFIRVRVLARPVSPVPVYSFITPPPRSCSALFIQPAAPPHAAWRARRGFPACSALVRLPQRVLRSHGTASCSRSCPASWATSLADIITHAGHLRCSPVRSYLPSAASTFLVTSATRSLLAAAGCAAVCAELQLLGRLSLHLQFSVPRFGHFLQPG